MTQGKSIPSEKSLKVKIWIGRVLAAPLYVAGYALVIGWSSMIGNQIMPSPSSIPERVHTTQMVTLALTPVFIALAFAVYKLWIQSSRRRIHYYRTMASGHVDALVPRGYKAFASVVGRNHAGLPYGDLLPVPVDVWKTLEVNDLYPWQT